MENTMLIQLISHLLKTMSDEDALKVVEAAKPELLKAAPEGAIVVEQTHDWFDVINTLFDTERDETEKLSDVCSAFVDAGYSGSVAGVLDDDAVKNLIDNDDDLYASVACHIIDRDSVIEWLQMNI